MNKRIVCICMSVLLCLTVICMDTGTDVHAGYYEDNDKYIKQRVADRMKEMSWEEKIAQMILVKAPAKNAANNPPIIDTLVSSFSKYFSVASPGLIPGTNPADL